MSSNPSICFRGESGETYRFSVFAVGTRFKPMGGVCLLTRRGKHDGNGITRQSHECVHLGRIEDLSQLSYDAGYFKDVDTVCVHLAANEEHRRAVEADLLSTLGCWNSKLQIDLDARVAPPVPVAQ